MKNKRDYIKYVIITIAIIILIPIVIDHLIIGNKFASNISNESWVSFLGSYIGALMGAGVTLLGLIITIKFTMAENKKDRRLTVAPYFKYNTHKPSTFKNKIDIKINNNLDENYINNHLDENIKKANTAVKTVVSLKNIGAGPAIDFKIHNIFFKNNELSKGFKDIKDPLESNSTLFIQIYLETFLKEIDNDNLIKYSPRDTSDKSGIFSMNVGYSDLIGNEYEQTVDFQVNIGGGTSGSKNDNGEIHWKYHKPTISIKNVSNRKLVQ